MDSALTTQRERERFLELLNQWVKNYLPTAPREQLDSIENAMLRWKPPPSRLFREFTD